MGWIIIIRCSYICCIAACSLVSIINWKKTSLHSSESCLVYLKACSLFTNLGLQWSSKLQNSCDDKTSEWMRGDVVHCHAWTIRIVYWFIGYSALIIGSAIRDGPRPLLAMTQWRRFQARASYVSDRAVLRRSLTVGSQSAPDKHRPTNIGELRTSFHLMVSAIASARLVLNPVWRT